VIYHIVSDPINY